MNVWRTSERVGRRQSCGSACEPSERWSADPSDAGSPMPRRGGIRARCRGWVRFPAGRRLSGGRATSAPVFVRGDAVDHQPNERARAPRKSAVLQARSSSMGVRIAYFFHWSCASIGGRGTLLAREENLAHSTEGVAMDQLEQFSGVSIVYRVDGSRSQTGASLFHHPRAVVRAKEAAGDRLVGRVPRSRAARA